MTADRLLAYLPVNSLISLTAPSESILLLPLFLLLASCFFLLIHLAKHRIPAVHPPHHVCKVGPAGHRVNTLQVHKGRRPDLYPEWPLSPIAYDIETKFPLGGLDRRVDLTLGGLKPMRDQLEVVDKGLHVCGDILSGRRDKLRDIGIYRPLRHLFQGLGNNLVGLPHLFYPHHVSVKAVSILACRHLEIKPVIDKIGRVLPDIPLHSGPSQRRAGKAKVYGILCGYNPDTLVSPKPDPVSCQELFILIHPLWAYLNKVPALFFKTGREVSPHPADLHVVVSESRTAEHLKEVQYHLPLSEGIKDEGDRP